MFVRTNEGKNRGLLIFVQLSRLAHVLLIFVRTAYEKLEGICDLLIFVRFTIGVNRGLLIFVQLSRLAHVLLIFVRTALGLCGLLIFVRSTPMGTGDFW